MTKAEKGRGSMDRKILLGLFAVVLAAGLAGCNAQQGADSNAEDSGAANSTAAVKTVSTKGMEMDYAVFGNGQKSFIILPGLSVHSVMGSADAIADAYSCFSEDYTVYVFDGAKEIHDGYTVRDMADDVAAAMKKLRIKDADIFGASMGGMTAVYLAIDHPELVHKIVLGSTLAKPNDAFSATIAEWEKLAQEKNETELLESFADRVYSKTTLDAYRDIIIESNRGISDDEYSRFLIQAAACASIDCYDELSEVKCPVLVLGAEGDKIVTAEGLKQIAEGLNCEIYLYGTEFGHGVYDEAPDFKQRCLDFFAGE